MNSVPNSDSEQCTETKLNCLHQVHTLAQPACALCRVAGLAWPCLRPGPNSDSEQCIESKLSCLHQVHTLAQPACALCHVAGLAWPCLRPGSGMSQAWPGCIVALCRRAMYSAPCRRVRRRVARLQRRIVAHYCVVSKPWCAVSRPKVSPLSHDTKFCIATLR